jgi:hypothetical protein
MGIKGYLKLWLRNLDWELGMLDKDAKSMLK